MKTYSYFLAPDISKLKKLKEEQMNQERIELKKIYGDEYQLNDNNELVSVAKECFSKWETFDRLAQWESFECDSKIVIKPNYHVRVYVTVTFKDESITYYNYEFYVFSPWNSLKNAINQVTEFMDKRNIEKKFFEKPTNVSWDLNTITRIDVDLD